MMLCILLVSAVAYVIWFYARVRRYPKGPTPLPLIGNMLQFRGTSPHEEMYELSKTYGPTFTLFLPKPLVVMNSFEDIRESLVVKGDHFSAKDVNNVIVELFSYVRDGGILHANGENWMRQRRLALTILRNLGVGKSVIEQKITTSVGDMLDHLDLLKDKTQVDMQRPLQLCIGNVIHEILFGSTYGSGNSSEFFETVDLLSEISDVFRSSEMNVMTGIKAAKYVPPFRAVHQQCKELIEKYQSFIATQIRRQRDCFREGEPAPNFVQAYLQEMNKHTHEMFNEDQLITIVSEFWFAGLDTASTTLRWALLYLMQWPDVQKKAQAEIDLVAGRDRLPCTSDKATMLYMTALITEVQRRASIVIISHLSTSDQVIGGKQIPAGTDVVYNLHAVMQKDPIFEDPDDFKPERFLQEDGKTFRKDLLERMVQFGMGKRQCAGEGLARMELFLVLTMLLQRYSFVPNGPLDLSPVEKVVLTPKSYTCQIIPRQ